MDVSTIVSLLALAGSLIGVWVQLNGRVVRLEAEKQHLHKRIDDVREDVDKRFADNQATMNRQFDQIMDHLRRIEDKLDGKADRA